MQITVRHHFRWVTIRILDLRGRKQCAGCGDLRATIVLSGTGIFVCSETFRHSGLQLLEVSESSVLKDLTSSERMSRQRRLLNASMEKLIFIGTDQNSMIQGGGAWVACCKLVISLVSRGRRLLNLVLGDEMQICLCGGAEHNETWLKSISWILRSLVVIAKVEYFSY